MFSAKFRKSLPLKFATLCMWHTRTEYVLERKFASYMRISMNYLRVVRFATFASTSTISYLYHIAGKFQNEHRGESSQIELCLKKPNSPNLCCTKCASKLSLLRKSMAFNEIIKRVQTSIRLLTRFSYSSSIFETY